jgi:hypothetical protein
MLFIYNLSVLTSYRPRVRVNTFSDIMDNICSVTKEHVVYAKKIYNEHATMYIKNNFITIKELGAWRVTEDNRDISGNYYLIQMLNRENGEVIDSIKCNGRKYDGPGNCIYSCFVHWQLTPLLREIKTPLYNLGNKDVVYI